MSVRFCSALDHTRTHKHSQLHMRLNTLPNTRRHSHNYRVPQTSSTRFAVTTFQNPQRSEMLNRGRRFRCRFADGFSDHIRFWFSLADVFLSILFHMDCLRANGAGAYICALTASEKGIYMKRKCILKKMKLPSRS